MANDLGIKGVYVEEASCSESDLSGVVILPCPFCGENSEVEQCEPSTARFNEGAVHFKVSCPPVLGEYISDCIGSQLNHWEITPEDAINKWNTRAV